MPEHQDKHAAERRRPVTHVAIVALAALAMGAPTIRGGFVGADDHRLVLNHVLVSQPSLAHTAELFSISHRDLYQPLPLASFAFEFAVARFFGMDAGGADGVAWLFHLDNALLHAINALLVWLVIVRLQGLLRSRLGADESTRKSLPGEPDDRSGTFLAATVAAVLFAVHPVQTEVVAWVNGRMMLLSTLFALLTLLSVTAFASAAMPDHGKRSRGNVAVACSLVFAVLCGLSKVRVGLPVLALVPIFIARRLRDRRVVLAWVGVVVVTGVFAFINIRTTVGANMFAGGAEVLHGPRLVRVLLALGSYFQHIVWPASLASFYPAPPVVAWGDGATLRALAVVVPVLVLWVWRTTRSLPARLGFVWFMATLASTLPIIPARNLLAADRYLYLPIVGLLWAVAAELVGVLRLWDMRGLCLRAVRLGGGVLVAVLVAVSWHVGSFYATAAAKTLRVAEVSPDTPRLWTRAGWARYDAGDYELAAGYAQRDLAFDDVVAKSGAVELIGACALRLGKADKGYSDLRRAFEIDPKNAKAMYRLGAAYAVAGDSAHAIDALEKAVEVAPRYNPALIRLADLYRDAGRTQKARSLYDRALESNVYDVAARRGLMGLDNREALVRFDALIERGSVAAGADLWLRLEKKWPESVEVHIWSTWAAALADRADDGLSGSPQHSGVPVLLAPLVDATRALVALRTHDYRTAAAHVDRLASADGTGRYAQRRLLAALQRYDVEHPGDAWTMCLAARLLIADGQAKAARAFVGVCGKQCKTDGCAVWLDRLNKLLASHS